MATTVTDGTTTLNPLQVTGFSSTRAATTQAHTIIGRTTGLPDITWGAPGARTGTLTFLVEGYANAVALENMHAQQLPITWAQTDIAGMGFQYALTGNLTVALVDVDYDFYTVAVDYEQTA